jgi:hypothetical protein
MKARGTRAYSTLFVAPLAACALLLGLSACGHPASKEECEVIVDKIIEIQTKETGMTDPARVDAAKKDARAKVGDDLLPKCVGKKIRDSALACIKNASTVQQITDICLQ